MSAQPVVFSGGVTLAADPTLPQAPVPLAFSGAYTALSASLLNVTQAGDVSVPFGSIKAPGAKGLFVQYEDQDGAAPAQLRLNNADETIEIAPGGVFVYFNPAPVAGITRADFTFTAPCQIRVWVLG